MSGRIIRERYRIIKSIGKGGFGETFLSKDLFLPGSPDRVVKQLKPQSLTWEGLQPVDLEKVRERFQKEAEALRQLGCHPEIPTLFEFFEENEEFYLIQEYICGRDLRQEFISGKCWSEARVINLLRDVLEILQFVHRQKQIHRDIKPANLIRRNCDSKLVLIDFGAVKDMTGIEGNPQPLIGTMMVGTREYMPNEQSGGKPRYCSDIYALGITAIQALVGIEAKNIEKDCATDEIIWYHLAPHVNSKLKAILDKMVICYFCNRYQSAEEVLKDLEYFPTSLPGKAQEVRKELPIAPPAKPCYVRQKLPISELEKTLDVRQDLPIAPPAIDKKLPLGLPIELPAIDKKLPIPPATKPKYAPVPSPVEAYENTEDSLPPTRTIGRYEIQTELGNGVLATTFKVIDTELPEKPRRILKQLKRLKYKPSSYQDAKYLFEKEVKVLYKLGGCDRLPKLLEHFESNKQFYLVYEYIEGQDLSQEIRTGKSLSASEVFDLMREILEILKFLHERNIIHSNINPRHLIRRKSDKEIVLIDLIGIKQMSELEDNYYSSTSGISTAGYVPKEQTDGRPNLSSDVYAVGTIGIQALTGLTARQLQQRIDPADGEIMWRDKTNLIPELADVLYNMVRVDCEQRYRSAKEARSDGFNKLLGKWIGEGNLHLSCQQEAIAIASYDRLLNRMPDFYRAWYKKGEALKKLGDCEAAMKCFQEAIDIKPEYFKALAEIGHILHQKGLYDEALEKCERAIEIDPGFHRSWYYKGVILHQKGWYKEAIESYKQAKKIEWEKSQAIEINSELHLACCGMADALVELERYEEAIKAYEEAIHFKMSYWEAWYGKAKMLVKMNRNEGARDLYKKATRINPKDFKLWYSLGEMLEKIGQHEAAIDAYKKALEIDPNSDLAKQKLKPLESSNLPEWLRCLKTPFNLLKKNGD